METNRPAFQWKIVRLPPSFAKKKCWALQVNTGILCNAKVETRKHGTPTPMYKGMKKFRFTNNVVYEYWFCRDDIKCCVNCEKKCVLDWLIVPSTWPMNIGINMFKKEVLMLEVAGFQLQQREALSPHCKLLTIATIFIPWLQFWVALNPDAHPTS